MVAPNGSSRPARSAYVISMRPPTALLAILGVLHACAWAGAALAQPPSRAASAIVEGRVSLSTGAPAVGATVTVLCDACAGRMHIDSTGRYNATIVPGEITLEVRCPSATIPGRVVQSTALVLTAGERRVFDAAIPANACAEPPFATERGDFRGIYLQHWEFNSFAFCTALPDMARDVLSRTELSVSDVAVNATKPAVLRALQRTGEKPNAQGHTLLYVEWRGTLAGPGTYGTWGNSPYQLTVDSVLLARPVRLSDCPLANRLAARTLLRFDTAAVVLAAWRATMRRTPSARRTRVLSLTSRVDLTSIPLSSQASRHLQQHGVPIVMPVDLFGNSRREVYHLEDVEMQADSSVRVVLTARFTVAQGRMQWYQSRTDSVQVLCRSAVCRGRVFGTDSTRR